MHSHAERVRCHVYLSFWVLEDPQPRKFQQHRRLRAESAENAENAE